MARRFTEHTCEEKSPTCRCYLLADEPNPDCPVHGYPSGLPHCDMCGRFFNPERTNA